MTNGYCSDVSVGTNEATINGVTYGVNTNIVNMQYVKVGNCEFSVDKANGLIKYFKVVKDAQPQQAPSVPRQAPQYSAAPAKSATIHKVITEVDPATFERELNEFSQTHDVFATQTHVKEGLWSGVLFYR